MFKQTEVAEKVEKGGNVLKHQLWHMPTMQVMPKKKGMRIRINYQLRDGPHWQAQDKKFRASEQPDNQRKKMLGAWPRELYKIVKSTQRILRQVSRTAAT